MFHSAFTFVVSPGYGAKGISIQVGDADGNVSRVLYRRLTYAAS